MRLAMVLVSAVLASPAYADPYYAGYSSGHKVFYEIVSQHAELKVNDKLNGYVPPELKEAWEKRKTVSTEYKRFSKEKCDQIMSDLIKASKARKGVVELQKESDDQTDFGVAKRKYITVKFPDSSYLYGRCSTYPNEDARMRIEASFKDD